MATHWNKQRGFTLADLLFAVILIVGFIGYVANIVKLLGMSLDPITGLAVVRIIGIFLPPLGAIMGAI